MLRQRIFISSVMHEYEDRREAVKETVQNLGMEPILAETIKASSGTPREAILDDAIGSCQAVIGIYGSRYGWTGSQSQISPTEEEYDRARKLYKPIYAFIDKIEDETVEAPQQAFLDKVQNWYVGVLRREFSSLEELQYLVREALTGRDLPPRYRKFLDQLTVQTQNLNGLAFREESEPFTPAFDLVLHATSNQFTAGIDNYILVIDGDIYNHQEIIQAIQTWFEEVNRFIGAGFWNARNASAAVLITVSDNPYGHNETNLPYDQRFSTSTRYDGMLVDLQARTVELPSSGRKPWINPLKKAVESAL